MTVTGEQEGEEERATVAIAMVAKRSLGSRGVRRVRIEMPCRREDDGFVERVVVRIVGEQGLRVLSILYTREENRVRH